MRHDALPLLVVGAAALGLLLVGAAAVTPSGAENPDESADRTISVDAVGDASSQPDEVVVTMAATAEGDTPSAVRDDLADGAQAIRENLADAGVAEDDYETSRYRIREPRRHPDERDAPAYEGVHAFEVTLDDPDRTGEIIDAAANADAEIGDVRFTLSDERKDDLRQEAIADAMDDARTQADDIAASGGLVVTSVTKVEASQRQYRPVRYDAVAAPAPEADDSVDGGTSIQTGDVSVSYQVHVTYNATTNR